MSRSVRLYLFLLGALALAVLFTAASIGLPGFGGSWHPYGERSVQAALDRHTANTIASVNFDQRAFDTLGEESILFASVLAAVVLLRQSRDERRHRPRPARVARGMRRYALLALPVTLVIGLYVIAHGQLSPGGGFQGGVVCATALHLLYIAIDYRALERLRPVGLFAVADAAGEAAYVLIGVAGAFAGSAYLANFLPLGTFNTLSSGGTVPLLNAAIGVEVACGIVVLLAQFLDQAVEIEGGSGPAGNEGDGTDDGEPGADDRGKGHRQGQEGGE